MKLVPTKLKFNDGAGNISRFGSGDPFAMGALAATTWGWWTGARAVARVCSYLPCAERDSGRISVARPGARRSRCHPFRRGEEIYFCGASGSDEETGRV